VKKAWIVGVIVGLHCLVVGSLMLIQGCGTPPKAPEAPVPPVVMPPAPPPPVPPPVVLPPVKVQPVPVEMTTKSYTVRSGDSLSRIAQRFNVTTRDIMKLNKLSDANKLRVGQKLTLPGYVDLNAPEPPRKAKKAAAKSVKPTVPAVASGEEYVVKAGDMLSKIAQAHGTTTRALREVNQLTSDKLKIGQKLALPRAAAAPAGEAPAVTPAATEVAPTEVTPPGAEPAVTPPEGAAAPAAVKPGEMQHIVEPNQDLNSIAMMYGVRVEELMKLNGLSSPEVKVGQTLKIPPPSEL
jgi:LysM repeat protein